MGVPKFFRWISERYPKINQRYGSPPKEETIQEHFPGRATPDYLLPPDPLSTCMLPPPIDRLYIDMNGIIHGCSHNNISNNAAEGDENDQDIVANITEEQIFQNICYYLDRIVKDIAQPTELVYMAIDGVAPRAKLNQQRARRYRSGKEGEIEQTVYDAHMQAMMKEQEKESSLFDSEGEENDDDGADYSFMFEKIEETGDKSSHKHTKVKEVEPGRFAGKFETKLKDFDHATAAESVSSSNAADTISSADSDGKAQEDNVFHSNSITPGTPFFQRCTNHIEHFIQRKISEDPAWQNLTIIFSGPNVPGEGEHKIMQFMREQRCSDNYNPNMRHCIMGQDGDLIMLGLATHEPNLVLLREKVLFDKKRRQAEKLSERYGLDLYIHNSNFEFLHMNVLRDYLAYEFVTSNVVKGSPFDLEYCIDDFVFLTFFVGNDFLPHMPALDIADEAFDLLFYTYREQRKRWIKEKKKKKLLPYLTDSGSIVSGKRLEEYLTVVGSHEVPYYDYKKSKGDDNVNAAREVVASKEESDRARFREIVTAAAIDQDNQMNSSGFQAVLSSSYSGVRTEDEEDREGLVIRLGDLLQHSVLSGAKDDEISVRIDDKDLKGRYYSDKFGFSPFDAEKHIALRKAYIEGLVWNLKYYYEGCVSWEWYYPYHYGPMLSDLVNLDEIIDGISFEGKLGAPLRPFEQLMACMPPSQANLLPAPYQPLMTEPTSPIAEFYPESFTIDMNGKRWPWEAVVLLPFIDSKRLLEAAQTVDVSQLTDEELKRNKVENSYVFQHRRNSTKRLEPVGKGEMFGAVESCKVETIPFVSSNLKFAKPNTVPLFKPILAKEAKVPLPGFPTLRDLSVQSLWRKKLQINVHGVKSRYKTSCLELYNSMPEVLPIEALAPELIGSLIYINYPHLIEALVTAISDSEKVIRGKSEPKIHTTQELSVRRQRAQRVVKAFVVGEKLVGTGGIALVGGQEVMDELEVLLNVRPFSGLATMPDGKVVKTFADFEIEVPLFVTSWAPLNQDPRLLDLPLRLEKDPFHAAKKDVAYKRLGASSVGKVSQRKIRPRLTPLRMASNFSSRGSRGLHTYSHHDTISSDPNAPFSHRSQPFSEEGLKQILINSVAIHLRTIGLPTFAGRLKTNFDAALKSQIRSSPFFFSYFAADNHSALRVSNQLSPTRFSGAERTLSKMPGRCGDSCVISGANVLSRQRSLHPQKFQLQSPRRRVFTIGLLAFLSFMIGAEAVRGSGKFSIAISPFSSGLIGAAEARRQKDGFDLSQVAGNDRYTKTTNPPDFSHGTTTVSFTFKDGIVAAVDSRASLGSFVGSKTTQKVLPINSHILGTMAGGAADCMFWIRKMRSEAALHELTEGRRMSVARASNLLSYALYENRRLGLSVGTMIMGFDDEEDAPPKIFYVDNTGARIEGDMFAVGSGSTFALGILDTERRPDMDEDEAVSLGIKAIRHATFRDASSGGFINVYLITRKGWKLVFSEDLDRSSTLTP